MVLSPIWIRNSDEGVSIMKLSPKRRIEWATTTKRWAGYLPRYFTVTRNGSIAVASVIVGPLIASASIIPGERLLITYLTKDDRFLKLVHYYPPYLFELISDVVLTPRVIVMSGAFASPNANGYLVVAIN